MVIYQTILQRHGIIHAYVDGHPVVSEATNFVCGIFKKDDVPKLIDLGFEYVEKKDEENILDFWMGEHGVLPVTKIMSEKEIVEGI